MNFFKIPIYAFLILLTISCGGLSAEEKAAGKSEASEIKTADKKTSTVSVVQQVSQSMIPVLEDYNKGRLRDKLTRINNGINIMTVEEGEGNRPQFGDMVFVHYYGVLLDGHKFDSSFDRMKPFSFKLGSQSVIPGWNDAITRMRTGGSYVVFVPPALAYGAQGNPNGGIPPNSELAFFIALLGFQ